ncbi:MAG: hypothetical protein ACK5W9_09585 [Bdellovibrionales bacterium]
MRLNQFKNVLLLSFFVGSQCWAGLLYTYNQLVLMELDQMNKLVQEKIKESKKADAKIVPLKEGFQAVLARPDQDRMIEKVAGPLRSEIVSLGRYEKAVTELTDEALNALTNTKNFKPTVQVTYVFFLENLMADMKPVLTDADSFEKKMVQKIEKAEIKLTKQALSELASRGFSDKKSPSDVAEQILEELKKSNESSKEKSSTADDDTKEDAKE